MKIINPYRFGQGGNGLLNNLVSGWEFEETGSDVALDSHGTNHGANNGATVAQEGVARGYDFDGTNDYVATGITSHYTDFSFSCWVYNTSSSLGFYKILEKNNGTRDVNIYITNSDRRFNISQEFSGGTGTWATPINSALTNTWYHVVFTYNSSSISNNAIIYINGVSQTITETQTPSGTLSTNTDQYTVGREEGSNLYGFIGYIDQPAIWNKILTQSEITQLYNTGVGLKYQYFDTGLKTNLVSLWELDEQANVLDAHGSNDGIINGATINQTGKIGQCYSFNADYINFGNNFNAGSAISFSLWLKTSDITTGGRFLFKNDGSPNRSYFFQLDNGIIDAFLSSNGVDADVNRVAVSSTQINDNNWHHVVIVYDGSVPSVSAYIDGSPDGTLTTNVPSSINSNSVDFNFMSQAGTNDLDGLADQLSIWSRALTSTEVSELYNSTSGLAYSSWSSGLKTDLVSVWELNETANVIDAHGSNDGTINGATVNQQGVVSNLERSYEFVYSNPDYISIPDNDNLSFTDGAGNDEPFSVSFWINFNSFSPSTGQWILNKRDNTSGGDEYQINYSETSDALTFILFDGISRLNSLRWRSSTSPFSISTWYHIVCVYDGSESTTGFTLYINNVENTLSESTENGTYTGMANGTVPVVIGVTGWGTSSTGLAIDGRMDQLSIWNRVLTSTEVSELYNSGNGLNYTKFSTALKTDLVSLWKLDETQSNPLAYDSHGNNDGTIVGATINQTGKVGKCYSFDGFNDLVNITDDNTLTFSDGSDFPFSISCWAEMDDASNFRILNKWSSNTDSEYIFGTNPSNTLQLVLYDNSASAYTGKETISTVTTYQNIWTHFAVTYDGRGGSNAEEGIIIYINGSSVSVSDVKSGTYSSMENTLNDLVIGNLGDFSTGWADGKIDQVFIWNVALTSDQVTALYNSGNGLAYSEFTA